MKQPENPPCPNRKCNDQPLWPVQRRLQRTGHGDSHKYWCKYCKRWYNKDLKPVDQPKLKDEKSTLGYPWQWGGST